jgi:hypothetical protein
LEYPSFTRYLGDKRVKKDEHIVVFHKKENKDSYNFFIKYSKERIGMDQIALAISISLLSGLLLYMPSYKKEVDDTYFSVAFWGKLPPEVVISTCLVIIVLLYFFIPFIVTYIMRIIGEIKKFIKETLRKR